MKRCGVIQYVRRGEEAPRQSADTWREWRCSHQHRDDFAAFECAVGEARRTFLRASHADGYPNTAYAKVLVATGDARKARA